MMDYILKEELWRSIGTFWFFLILSIVVFGEVGTRNVFTMLILPIILTIAISLLLVLLRKRKKLGKILVSIILGIMLSNGGILLIVFNKFSLGNLLIIVAGAILLVYGLIKIFSLSKVKK